MEKMTMAGPDDRAVSEGAGVAVLVLLTVAVTASVGLSVMTAPNASSDVDAEFSFKPLGDRLLIASSDQES